EEQRTEMEQRPSTGMDELLQMKPALPRMHARLAARAPLLAKLDTALECKLTLLSAPAGFGKTTLVGQWLSALRSRDDETVNRKCKIQNLRTAWVSLDAGDNDPVRFWRYVISLSQQLRS